MIRVTGYLDDGVAYTLEADATQPVVDPDYGIVTHASPTRLLAVLHTRDGQTVAEHAVGSGVTVNRTSYEGILAALRDGTEIVAATGADLPDWFTGGTVTAGPAPLP